MLLELHVPCRDPVDHLMSECNFRLGQEPFDCTKDLIQEAQKCFLHNFRFSNQLEKLDNTTLKCFNFRSFKKKYASLMGSILQRKRITASYVHRSTNRKRRKADECIWGNATKKAELERYLVENIDYHGFCHRCMGTKDDLIVDSVELNP